MPGDAALCHRVTFVPTDPLTWAQAGKLLLPALSGSRAWCGDVKLGFLEQRKSGLPSCCGGEQWVPEAELRLNEKVFSLFFFFSAPVPAGGEQAAGRTVQD